MTLERDIAGVIDETADPIGVDEIRGRAQSPGAGGGDRRGPAPLLVAAAVVAAVVAAIGVFAWWPSGNDTSVVAGLPDTTTDPASFAGAEWEQIGSIEGELASAPGAEERTGGIGALTINRLRELPSGLYAVGTEQARDGGFVARVWRAGNDETWDRLGGEAFGDDRGSSRTAMAGIAERDGTVVAAGQLGGPTGAPQQTEPTAWWSDDAGATWHAVTLPLSADAESSAEAGANVAGIAAGPDGFVVVGFVSDGRFVRPAAWRSDNGVEWEVAPFGTSTDRVDVIDIEVMDDRYVVVGTTGAYQPGSAAMAWTSTDGGHSWTPSDLDDIASTSGTSGITSVAAGPDGLLAVGYRQAGDATSVPGSEATASEPGLDVDHVLWFSPDGLTWVERAPLDLPGPGITMVAAGAGGFLLTSLTSTDDGQVVIDQLTTDGTDRQVVESPPGGASMATTGTVDGFVAAVQEMGPSAGGTTDVRERLTTRQVWRLEPS
ncbi:MAG: sialidase family protein [Actinomycetota bacterium]|nr:sialidase family protein [Actinomycetota bacterium]